MKSIYFVWHKVEIIVWFDVSFINFIFTNFSQRNLFVWNVFCQRRLLSNFLSLNIILLVHLFLFHNCHSTSFPSHYLLLINLFWKASPSFDLMSVQHQLIWLLWRIQSIPKDFIIWIKRRGRVFYGITLILRFHSLVESTFKSDQFLHILMPSLKINIVFSLGYLPLEEPWWSQLRFRWFCLLLWSAGHLTRGAHYRDRIGGCS